ncbi:MAG: hypothetical protein QOK31_863 [Solirubrobacteraceae bacterium]|jgi:hypothetical protein|nr:hypothetical protein [Solirubrobacteraceae bacterium]
MGNDLAIRESETFGDLAPRDGLLQSVGDVREVVFVLLERAREVGGRQTTVVDALQLVANDLGMVESMLRVQSRRRAA